MPRAPLRDPEPLMRAVYAYVAYRLGEGADAEDVTSETLERALRYRNTYDRRKGEPLPWLIGIARRCIQEARTRRIPTPTDSVEEAASARLEDDAIERVALAAALTALDERDRELIALRYGADLTARQIGELFGARTNAIEVALHRARGRLRALLEDGDRRRLRDSAGDGRPVRVSGAGRYSG